MLLSKDILHSLKLSFDRNGFWSTLIILLHYFALKFSRSEFYVFYFRPFAHKVYLRHGTSDFSVLRQIGMNGEYDLSFPIEPEVIIDAGANIGLASLYFHSRFPNAKIYSLEPDGGNFDILRKQVIDIPSVQIFKLALWGKKEKLMLDSAGADAWGIQVRQSIGTEQGQVMGIDLSSFMIEQNIEIIDLLKIDIEGSEMEVFKGDFEYWLKRTRILVIELHEDLRTGCSLPFSKAIQSISHRVENSGENVVVYNLDLL